MRCSVVQSLDLVLDNNFTAGLTILFPIIMSQLSLGPCVLGDNKRNLSQSVGKMENMSELIVAEPYTHLYHFLFVIMQMMC